MVAVRYVRRTVTSHACKAFMLASKRAEASIELRQCWQTRHRSAWRKHEQLVTSAETSDRLWPPLRNRRFELRLIFERQIPTDLRLCEIPPRSKIRCENKASITQEIQDRVPKILAKCGQE